MPHPELNKSLTEAMFGRNLKSRLDLMFPQTEENNNEKNRIIPARKFEKGERVAMREYLNKNIKWHFVEIIKVLGKLHYIVKMDNGKIWKRHVNQMRKIGNKTLQDTHSKKDYYNGDHKKNEIVPSENEEGNVSKPQNFSSDSSNRSGETLDFEKGETVEANIPPAGSPSKRLSLVNGQEEVEMEGRPQRSRKPPDM